MRIKPTTLIELHNYRPMAVKARERLVKKYPKCVFLIEKYRFGWGIYQGEAV